MVIVAFTMLAVLLGFVCFWREISPGLAWLALQYHTTPEMLAALYTGGDTHVDEVELRVMALAEQRKQAAHAARDDENIRAIAQDGLRDHTQALAASVAGASIEASHTRVSPGMHAESNRKQEAASV
ncbi:hypothetical protein [Paraburkholderia rhizosphaerae]|uniref:Uncharacterized protein n=1 Tax=Paraburkholderia rhizosphaerae TaxID=480658 RepID=A0A4R8L468_9BURK|nr:hypothetical protein [Paraburkholderia rhizosphaerae]TDY37386.1 hypothetical protein BX592_13829 [Paraburkholderia rhizosphaerae]